MARFLGLQRIQPLAFTCEPRLTADSFGKTPFLEAKQ